MIGLLDTKYWAVSEIAFERYLPLVLERLKNGKDLNIFKKEERASFNFGGRDPISGLPVFRSFPNVAYIPVIGGLTKHGDLCSLGMRELGSMTQAARASENIQSLLFEFDGPGGGVDGLKEFATTIKNSEKPTIAFIDGQCASAHYYLASQCDFIIVNSLNSAELGSIGTLYVHVNQAKKIENEVGEVTIFRASQSIDKARINAIEPLTEEQKAEIIEDLTQHAEDFKQTVISGRGTKLKTGSENIFTGKMYPKKDALKMGMADAEMTIDEAVEKAATLARSGGHKKIRNSKSNNQTQNKDMFGKWLNGSTGAEKAADEEMVSVLASELKELKGDMQNAQVAFDALNTQKVALEGQVSALNSSIAAKDAEITSLKEQVAKLEKVPAQDAAGAPKSGDASNQSIDKVEKKVDEQAQHFAKIGAFRTI